MDDFYDIVFIGGGPAGYVGAIKAAQLGFKSACVEQSSSLGGTCLHVGCIPSKTLLHGTELLYFLQEEKEILGIELLSSSSLLASLMCRKEKVIQKLVDGIAYLFKKNGVMHIQGKAEFDQDHCIVVDKKRLKAKYFVIATGSQPTALPFLPFDEKIVLSSTGALSMQIIPDRMLIIGGGVIGLELGSVFRRLGSQISVIEYMDRILPEFDRDISINLQSILEQQGFSFYLSTAVASASIASSERSSDPVIVETKDGERFFGDVVLVSVGRKPCILSGSRLALDARGHIHIDENFRTSTENIFAIGDVSGSPMLAHKASREAIALVESLAGMDAKIHYAAIPSVLYTFPEAASVGFSEDQLQEKKISYTKNIFPMTANARYLTSGGHDRCFVKSLFHEGSQHLLGVHMVMPNASECISQPVSAIQHKLARQALLDICFPHPTLSEAMHEVYSPRFLHL